MDIDLLLPHGMPGWTPEETSVVNEIRINEEPIDWAAWARSPEILPLDAAKLAHHINPLKWRDYKTSLGELSNEQHCSIDSLANWLNGYSPRWTLSELVHVLGNGAYAIQLPYGMRQAVKPNPPETLMRKEARLSAAQTLGLDVSKNTHYFFPPALRAKRIARLQCPFDKAKQSEFTRQIEANLKRSNPESDYHATYSAADVMGLLEEPYQKPSEHIRAWYNATQPPLPIGTAEPDITPDTQPRQERKLNKLEKQQQAILAVIALKQFEAMAIPDGEKGTIQFICEAEYHELFRAETAFDRAWKTGNGTKWRMEHYESYAHRGKD